MSLYAIVRNSTLCLYRSAAKNSRGTCRRLSRSLYCQMLSLTVADQGYTQRALVSSRLAECSSIIDTFRVAWLSVTFLLHWPVKYIVRLSHSHHTRLSQASRVSFLPPAHYTSTRVNACSKVSRWWLHYDYQLWRWRDIPCAIALHAGGADADEVIFVDLARGSDKHQPGYKKIRLCGEQAQQDGLR